VRVADPGHPLVAGVEPFDTTDELYHVETYGALHVLLDTECTEPGTGFVEAEGAPGTHPVFYIKQHGDGAVLYLTLGHCRGHYDLQPLADWWPSVDRCAWDLPVFRTLLSRGMEWAKPTRG
jgi:type 1 glutamine amidotransferase